MQLYGGLNAPVAPVVIVPNVSGRPMPVFVTPQQPQVAPQPQQIPIVQQPSDPHVVEEDLKQVIKFHFQCVN